MNTLIEEISKKGKVSVYQFMMDGWMLTMGRNKNCIRRLGMHRIFVIACCRRKKIFDTGCLLIETQFMKILIINSPIRLTDKPIIIPHGLGSCKHDQKRWV